MSTEKAAFPDLDSLLHVVVVVHAGDFCSPYCMFSCFRLKVRSGKLWVHIKS